MTSAVSAKIDLKKQFKFLYNPSAREVSIVDVPKMKFLMVDGVGDPNSETFHTGIQSLYNLAYTIKFGLKKQRRIDFPVMALEGLWSMGTSMDEFDPNARDKWEWTLMIMQPEVVTRETVKTAVEEIKRKGKPLTPFRLEELREGLSAQIMHVGPYSAEAATIRTIREFMERNGYSQNGRHHEIYLGDPRRAAPSKLRTILRWPVKLARKA
jgi:hypothetical protein